MFSFPLRKKQRGKGLLGAWHWPIELSKCCVTCVHSRILFRGTMTRKQHGSYKLRDLLHDSQREFSCLIWTHFGFLALLSFGGLFSFIVISLLNCPGPRLPRQHAKKIEFTFQVYHHSFLHSLPLLAFLLTPPTKTSETFTTPMWCSFCNPPKPVFFFFFLASAYFLLCASGQQTLFCKGPQ